MHELNIQTTRQNKTFTLELSSNSHIGFGIMLREKSCNNFIYEQLILTGICIDTKSYCERVWWYKS